MSRTLPFQRSPQASRARLSKAQLLPIPRAVANELALQVHLSLQALRAGATDIAPAQQITEAMLLARFLSEAGHGDFSHDALMAADRIMAEVFDGGRESGTWTLAPEAFEQIAAIVSLYDHQLQRATLAALTTASERLDRFKAGEAYQPMQQRRALS
ncbi:MULTISPECIES: hypothetical protein [unclassified Caballeronia]|uniref:hypothetical protein n=1 Tax=unclassified Caballeronia TaxID=2646786 RepID=UPI001FD2E57C|nr:MULTISPECIES: hypothetical protein [unclassified Caballeronia]MDR5773689.1 hypothetical protein [Caballeronia sp. LZ002]MDR5805668.1 hypothetical protein [Caballeronia sp. LZ001]MDR5849123.1 hypothetical protein [Caballeronia sp. LZ003]